MAAQTDITNNMIAQLRLLDPAISAAVGTIENKILNVVGGAIANAEVGLNSLSGALDINSKTGDNLDRFLANFGYARQTSTQATGFVTFSCASTPVQDIVIPANTQLFANITSPANTGSLQSTVYFLTQFQGTIPANSNPAQVTVPIIAQIGGSTGNVAANAITNFGNAPVFGVTSVTNPTATTGGTDTETDAEFQTRFQNTVFRNLAGTSDQYLGLIASTQNTTQATVIGPISRYQEYIQIPPVDDASSYTFILANGTTVQITGNGTAGNYTTALSTVPNSKYIITTVPNFVTNGQQGAATAFYREGIDWFLNTAPSVKNQGDAYRFWTAQLPGAPNPLSTNAPTIFQPNVTFVNVDTSGESGVQTTQPEQTVLFEHAYTSSASRNYIPASITNCVDIYVNGSNNVTANTNLAIPTLPLVFNNVAGSFLNVNNYQRFGSAGQTPSVGNYYFSLYSNPVTSLPSQIAISGITSSGVAATTFYSLGVHYFLIQDVTDLYGTIRSRNGIEFNPGINGDLLSPGDGLGQPLNAYQTGTTFSVNGYTYDKNIVDLQAMCEAAKQITTDVLVHQAVPRYFKLDITVVYASGSSFSSVNLAIQSAVSNYFARQTFGALIQLGSIIQIIFAVPGVQNVRWSADLPFGPGPGDHRVTETDINGNPITPTSINPGFQDEDFFIFDDNLAQLPTGALPTDTLPGLIIRPRAENSWTRGPYNPILGPGNLPIQPPD